MPTRSGKNGHTTLVPNRKINVAVVAGAVSGLLVWILNDILPEAHRIGPAPASWITTILIYAASWVVPPAKDEQNITTP